MAKPSLPEGKKRYSVSLTQEKVDKFHSLCRDLSLQPRVMSEIFDDALDNMTAYFQTIKQDGVKGYAQVLGVMARQMSLLEEKSKEVIASESSK